MFTRPEDLTDDEVRDALASTWGLDVASVETLDARLLEAYRLRWDLADVASFAADLRAPHGDDDIHTARAGLRAVLEEGEP